MNAQIFMCLCMAVFIPTALSNWQNIPGAAIDISAKGNEVWVTSGGHSIYRFDFVKRDWVTIPGSAFRVGASPDGWTWVVNINNDVYRFNKDKGGFEQIPGQKLVQISAASKDRALGVNSAGNIWLWENNVWKQIPGGAMWAGIGVDDDRWVVNSGHQIFRWNKVKNDWDLMPGAAVNVDVQNADRVTITNKEGNFWVWKNNEWKLIPSGTSAKSSVNENMGFYINKDTNQLIFFSKFNADGISLAPFAWPEEQTQCYFS